MERVRLGIFPSPRIYMGGAKSNISTYSSHTFIISTYFFIFLMYPTPSESQDYEGCMKKDEGYTKKKGFRRFYRGRDLETNPNLTDIFPNVTSSEGVGGAPENFHFRVGVKGSEET